MRFVCHIHATWLHLCRHSQGRYCCRQVPSFVASVLVAFPGSTAVWSVSILALWFCGPGFTRSTGRTYLVSISESMESPASVAKESFLRGPSLSCTSILQYPSFFPRSHLRYLSISLPLFELQSLMYFSLNICPLNKTGVQSPGHGPLGLCVSAHCEQVQGNEQDL